MLAMDKDRHRLLTENVSYFQKNLTVTRDLVDECVDKGIFSEDEGHKIWVILTPFSFLQTRPNGVLLCLSHL